MYENINFMRLLLGQCNVISISNNTIITISQGCHSGTRAHLNCRETASVCIQTSGSHPFYLSFLWPVKQIFPPTHSEDAPEQSRNLANPAHLIWFCSLCWIENLRDQMHVPEKSSRHFALAGSWASSTSSKLLLLPVFKQWCFNKHFLSKPLANLYGI